MLLLQQAHLLQLETLQLTLHPLVLLQQPPVLRLKLMRLGPVEGELVLDALRSLQVAQLLGRLILDGEDERVVLLDEVPDLALQHLDLLLVDEVGVLEGVDLGVQLGVCLL